MPPLEPNAEYYLRVRAQDHASQRLVRLAVEAATWPGSRSSPSSGRSVATTVRDVGRPSVTRAERARAAAAQASAGLFAITRASSCSASAALLVALVAMVGWPIAPPS